VKVTLFDGSFHEVDSNEMAFKMAASMAFKEGMRLGKAAKPGKAPKAPKAPAAPGAPATVGVLDIVLAVFTALASIGMLVTTLKLANLVNF